MQNVLKKVNNLSRLGQVRVFRNRYALLSYGIMSCLLAFTIVISNTLVERNTDLKLLLISYTNIIFMVMLTLNHTNFLSLKYTEGSNGNDSNA